MKKWVDAEVMELSLTETNCSNPWEWFIPKPIRPLRPVKPSPPGHRPPHRGPQAPPGHWQYRGRGGA